jgi:hypothetical protein
MAIFARKRIQGMLDKLRPRLSANTVSNLLGRLNDKKRPEQLLGAEMELGLLWSRARRRH